MAFSVSTFDAFLFIIADFIPHFFNLGWNKITLTVQTVKHIRLVHPISCAPSVKQLFLLKRCDLRETLKRICNMYQNDLGYFPQKCPVLSSLNTVIIIKVINFFYDLF